MIAELVGNAVIGFGFGAFYGFATAWRGWVRVVALALIVVATVAAVAFGSPAAIGESYLSIGILGTAIGVVVGLPVGESMYKSGVGDD